MAKETDEMYNTKLALGSNSYSTGKENLRPQRVVQRSKYCSSPFDVNTGMTILPIHQKVWEAVTSIGDNDRMNT